LPELLDVVLSVGKYHVVAGNSIYKMSPQPAGMPGRERVVVVISGDYALGTLTLDSLQCHACDMCSAIYEQQVRPKSLRLLDQVVVDSGQNRADQIFILEFLVCEVEEKAKLAFPFAWREVLVPRKLFTLMAELLQGAEYRGLVKFGTPISGDQYLQTERPL